MAELFDRKKHWEKIYQTKQAAELSWYQQAPATSIELIGELNLPKTAKIFDNGAGDSFFVDHLIQMGYQDITLLDISANALEKVKRRLGNKTNKVKWIVDDESSCKPGEKFDLWHDRAAFHFLTDESEITNYIKTINKFIKPGGYFIIGTFSEQGPEKCSGIAIKQYSEKSMTELLKENFEKIKCITVDHITPFNTVQNFLFCIFKRLTA